MDPTIIALSVISALLELLRQSHETNTPLTQEQVDTAIRNRQQAESDNAAGDPR